MKSNERKSERQAKYDEIRRKYGNIIALFVYFLQLGIKTFLFQLYDIQF